MQRLLGPREVKSDVRGVQHVASDAAGSSKIGSTLFTKTLSYQGPAMIVLGAVQAERGTEQVSASVHR